MQTLRILALVALGGWVAACSLHMGDLTALASKNVAVPSAPLRRQVEGLSCIHWVLFIPVGGIVPDVEEAMDQALAQVPEGNAMVNIAMYYEPLPLLVYTRNCLRVKGDVVKVAAGR